MQSNEPAAPVPPEANPLLEADPASLDHLFSADPLTLQDKDIEAMIVQYRKQRLLWEAAEAEGKKQAPKSATAKAAAKAKLSLDDLD